MKREVKTKKKCCGSRPRCKRCAVVCRRLERAGLAERRSKRHYVLSLDLDEKTLKRARKSKSFAVGSGARVAPVGSGAVSSANGKPPSVGIVGAGFGGVGMAIRLKQAGIDDIVVYERGESVGGVWRANTYPGAACDVPSHLYSFSFAPGHEWSSRYAPQPEILGYLERLSAEFGIDRAPAARHRGDRGELRRAERALDGRDRGRRRRASSTSSSPRSAS